MVKLDIAVTQKNEYFKNTKPQKLRKFKNNDPQSKFTEPYRKDICTPFVNEKQQILLWITAPIISKIL